MRPRGRCDQFRRIGDVVQLVGIASHKDRNDPFVLDLQGGRLNEAILDGDEAGREIY